MEDYCIMEEKDLDYLSLLEDEDCLVDEKEILPSFSCNTRLLHRLAYIKRCLRLLALNTMEEHTKIDAIRLQDEIDKIVVIYSLDCVDDYLLG